MESSLKNVPFKDRLQSIQNRIEEAAQRSGRALDAVQLIGVSKTVGVDAIRQAFGVGIRVFGENKIQEVQSKKEALSDLDIEWHFIGHLQKNKARFVPGAFHRVHTIDSSSIADAVHRASQDTEVVTDVLLQVNVSGEESKFGISPEALPELAEQVMDLAGLKLKGLMTLPPFDEDKEKSRPHFAKLRTLMEETNTRLGLAMNELSMGMSHDFEIAIEEGATCVRIGTALFGSRTH